MRSSVSSGDQRQFYFETQSRVRARAIPPRPGQLNLTRVRTLWRAQAASLLLRAVCPEHFRGTQGPTRDLNQRFISASCRDEQAGSLCSPALDHCVSHTHVHNSGSSSDLARCATRTASAFSHITANTVDPEPDISATLTPAWL